MTGFTNNRRDAWNATFRYSNDRSIIMNGNQRFANHSKFPTVRSRITRRGSVLGLMAIVLPVLAILAAFCVNLAQMQLTRTELMVATDAAARAGGRAFSEHQTVEAAKTAALATAALNNVNHEPLQLNMSDGANEMEFGNTYQPGGAGGRYVFNKVPTSQVDNGTEIVSAFRVHGRRDGGSLSGTVPLVIPGILNQSEFSTNLDAVAMQVDRDISLVLDRSGSMSWATFDWPSGISPWNHSVYNAAVDAGVLYRHPDGGYWYTSGNNSTSFQQWAWEEHFELENTPTRPWDDLVLAVDAFLNVLETTVQNEKVSLASYSTYGTLDEYLQDDYEVIRSTIDGLSPTGNTAIGLGMQEGIDTLLDSAARPFAEKTMVVMTDGIHNTGIDPVTVATNFVATYNLTIHTVTFGSGADQARMQQVASIGGGRHYHAATGAELVSIFEEIANNLPTILTK